MEMILAGYTSIKQSSLFQGTLRLDMKTEEGEHCGSRGKGHHEAYTEVAEPLAGIAHY